MQSLNLTLTDAAREEIDAFMERVDYDESIPSLIRHPRRHSDGTPAGEQWLVNAYKPERIRFFELLGESSGVEFFFKCDGVVILLWQPSLASVLQGRTLDYSMRRYVLR